MVNTVSRIYLINFVFELIRSNDFFGKNKERCAAEQEVMADQLWLGENGLRDKNSFLAIVRYKI